MIKGMSHEDLKQTWASKNGQPVTLEVLLLLEMELEDMEKWLSDYKTMLWSVAKLAFFGSFRIGELLSKKVKTIDPDMDLLLKEVMLVKRLVNKSKVELLEVTLKSPKELA